MAFRIHDSIVRGEIGNRTKGTVKGKIWDYFLTHFGERESFLNEGRPSSNPKLLVALTLVCQSHLKDASITLTNGLFIEVPGKRFSHGGALACTGTD